MTSFTSAQECCNFKFKSRICEKKIENSAGYRVNTKCTWMEVIVNSHKTASTSGDDRGHFFGQFEDSGLPDAKTTTKG